MSPNTWRTIKLVVGILLVVWWTLSVTFVVTPQLHDTSFNQAVVWVAVALGLLVVLIVAIYLIVRSNGKRYHHK